MKRLWKFYVSVLIFLSGMPAYGAVKKPPSDDIVCLPMPVMEQKLVDLGFKQLFVGESKSGKKDPLVVEVWIQPKTKTFGIFHYPLSDLPPEKIPVCFSEMSKNPQLNKDAFTSIFRDLAGQRV